MKQNIFLNKKYLVKWTNNDTAFLVQSPFNSNAGIWWSSKWYQPIKKYPNYFATGIEQNLKYKEIVYGEQGIVSVNLILGSELLKQFNYLKTSNSIKYLQMTFETKRQLEKLQENQISLFKESFIKQEILKFD